jgi:hypothetical protein
MLNLISRETMKRTLVRVSDYPWPTTMVFKLIPLCQMLILWHCRIIFCSCLSCSDVPLNWIPYCIYLSVSLCCMIYQMLWWIMKYIRMSDFRDAIALMRRCLMFWAALYYFVLINSLVPCFNPIYPVIFAASLFWKCSRLYICFIVRVPLHLNTFLSASTVEGQVMSINCNNMMGVILLWFPSI